MAIKYIQSNTLYLAGSGVVVGATSVTITSLTDIYGNVLTLSDFGTKGYITLEPDTSNEEAATFTSVTANANGTYTLGGVATVIGKSPYTETSGLVRAHAGGSKVVVTDNVGFWNLFTNKNNDETIVGSWTVPTPIASGNPTTKAYVDGIAMGGTTTVDKFTVAAVAGEALVAGNLVYLKSTDGFWWKATGSTAATIENTQIGIAQGVAAGNGSAITNGVLLRGTDANQTGGVAGSLGYISNTSLISTSAGTTERAVGQFKTASLFYFDPNFYYSLTAAQKAALSTAAEKAKLTAIVISTGQFGGSGTDGALNVISGTTTIDLGSASIVTKHYTSINISVGATVNFSNPHANGTIIRLKSQGAVTIAGTLDASGMGADGGAGVAGSPGLVGTNPNGILGTENQYGLGGDKNASPVIVAGGATATLKPLYATNNFIITSHLTHMLPGAGGGAGGGGVNSGGNLLGGAGGKGGGAIYIECAGALNFTGTINTSGLAGSNGLTNTLGTGSTGYCSSSGGGGGAAGNQLIIYNTLTANSGTMTSAGGAGGLGGSSSGGGVVSTQTSSGSGAGSLSAVGGAGVNTTGANGNAAAGTGAGGSGGAGRSADGAASTGGAGGATMSGIVIKNSMFA